MKNRIQSIIQHSIETKLSLINDQILLDKIMISVGIIEQAYQKGNKVLFCGNGGSAADAQHLAAELSGRFYKNRKALYAEALHTNTSYITAAANDYSFDMIYERLVEGMGKSGDVLVGISTSGNSNNIVLAMNAAQKLDMKTIGFTGKDGGRVREYSDILINIPSDDTPRIQECHILVGHIICQLVEEKLFVY